MLTIQEVNQSEEIIQVIHSAFKRYENDPMPSSALAETPATIEEELNAGIRIVGAKVKDVLVGVAKVTSHEDHLYFSRLAVLPTFQGQGIASKLVTCIEQLAMKEQVASVQCKVRTSETDNIRLYTKLGYSITKEEVVTSPLGFVMEVVTMTKKL